MLQHSNTGAAMRPNALIVSVILASCLPGAATGQTAVKYQITVAAGAHERRDVPVRAELLVPAQWADKASVALSGPDGKPLPAQLAPPALLDQPKETPKGMSRQVVWWIVPKLPARESATFQATVSPNAPAAAGFAWQDTAGKHVDLTSGKRPVLRYLYQAYDSDPAKRDLNNKPFHHLFDPAGERLVTKGSGGFETHHQGLFYGFTQCQFEGGTCNTWYCHDGEHELHKKFLQQIAGPVLARHRMEIDWNDRQGKTFAAEVRELSAYAVGGGTLVEFASRLRSTRGAVTLSGDAHHAGFQFRADDEVNKRRKDVYFLRTTGKGNLGEEKNDKTMANLPWNAMSFVLAEQRYTALYIDHPKNPKPALYSERTYGRFGSAPAKQVLQADGPPLELNYRVWLQSADLTVEQATALAAAFAQPPETKATSE